MMVTALGGAPEPTGMSQEEAVASNQRPKSAADKTGPPPSRFSLRLSAGWWRSLQCIGMGLHFLASPRPPNPSFTRTVQSTISGKPGSFTLQFYVPENYSSPRNLKVLYPTVINFHGGGFTLGNATDDARFAAYVVSTCNAIFVSVDYRLAPEYPFPTAVEDGADALLYVINNATSLKINPLKLATSGFSAGGNIAITATLRLEEYVFQHSEPKVPPYSIRSVAAWYPIIDYTLSRAERRATCTRPELTLSPTLTALFDASYLFPPELDLRNPYVSPSRASDEVLAKAIPPHVQIYTCEYDMLRKEGEDFARRLQQPPINKDVIHTTIPGVVHGWDKGPNPKKPPEGSEKLYETCALRLREVFNEINS